MKISVIGTGYVGLVTGVCLSEMGYQVTCIDIDKEKVKKMKQGISPIHEPELQELMIRNLDEDRLAFTVDYQEGLRQTDIIFIAVGTPQREDGSANLQYIDAAAKSIAQFVTKDVIIVTKSTVPVGTNDYIKSRIIKNLQVAVQVHIVSCPEFLREGSAVKDTFHGDRIVIGADDDTAAMKVEALYKPFNIPIFHTDVRSAELIKYASNAFLATKISFINEISNICEKLGANIEDVAKGMGYDQRIGPHFLRAGIGYGGSCFPKDTNALVQIAGNVEHDFDLLKSVIHVNNKQQSILIQKITNRFGSLKGKRVALLGLSFKPDTDDMREAPSIPIAKALVHLGAIVSAYDPIAEENAKKVFPKEVIFSTTIEEAIHHADMTLILTECKEIKQLNLNMLKEKMKTPILFDGRNCFDLNKMESFEIEYHSMGRRSIIN
ncbi:UDP-glucose/GDP-mannose dehydrogenase family protein [Bacillus sp. 03113]|uniref:UDP-glucose dehydrogenase family protein n=1 Tax=Bacillus sp. 03113 TaxID=2578211 RepID=UPI001144DE8C|nr:UDP-glucose/GDP-mannose dehydrogenase family protein [Bacillus sp. 03113]